MENVHRKDETDSVVLGHPVSTQADSKAIAHRNKPIHPDNEYSMKHEKRGIAVVINQENFDSRLKLHTREGAIKDRDDVCAALEKLQFEVRVSNDPTKKTLFDQLGQIAKEDHTNNDCLVVVVMTHGDTGVLYAKDEAYKIDELWNKFTGDSCKTLHGKPKLFFIQGCLYEKSQTIQSDTVDAQDTSRAKRPTPYTIPTMANLLVMYSIYDGDKPWRDASNGSWFIQSLCEVFNTYGHSKELLQMLTVVSRKVVNNYRQFVPDNEKGAALKKMPSIVSMLTKALYFRPKRIPDKPLGVKNIIFLDCNDLPNSQVLSNANPKSRKIPPPRYAMQGMQRKAYIFYNQTFDECLNNKCLNSGINDLNKLKSALETLRFSVGGPYRDLKQCEMQEKLNSIASENHETTGCILFAIMTYGKNNLLYAKNGSYAVTELWNRFSDINCPTLSGKPKVFLIQACTNGETNYSVHPPKDVLVMYSFYSEIADRIDTQAQLTQSVFIETLCDELLENGNKEELSTILLNVTRYVANSSNQHIEQDSADRENREANNPMPILTSRLGKSLYFS